MSDTLIKEKQQELFEEFSPSTAKRVERIPVLAKSNNPILITTTTEQLLLVGIVGILVLCSIFFLGVLRGKALRSGIMGESVSVVSRAPLSAAVVAPPVSATPSTPRSVTVSSGAPRTVTQPTALSVPVASKPYTIQLVTHRGKVMAENEVLGLQKAGHISFIIPSGEYYQVCVGQYFSKEDAKNHLRLFTGRFKDSFVRRR